MRRLRHKFCVVIALWGTLAVFIACSPDGDKPSSEGDAKGPIEAKPAPSPAQEGGTSDNEIPDYSVAGLIENWPDDVPFMEPYEIVGHLPDHGGFKQITLIIQAGFEEAFNFYSENLFDINGWEPDEESKSGLPGVFLTFKCRKDDRELAVMLKVEDKGEKTLVQLRLTDLKVYRQQGE